MTLGVFGEMIAELTASHRFNNFNIPTKRSQVFKNYTTRVLLKKKNDKRIQKLKSSKEVIHRNCEIKSIINYSL